MGYARRGSENKLSKKQKKTDKSLPLGLKLLLVLLLTCSIVGTGLFAGLAYNNIFSLVFAVPSAIIGFISLLFLLKDYKNAKKEKTTKWYADKYLAALVPVLVMAAIVLIADGSDTNEPVMYAGILMFPVISVFVAPNAALYALKDMKGWKRIFYGKGNLENFKDNKEFYTVKTPVSFEKRIFRAVVKDQILNGFTLISLMVIGAIAGLISILTYDSHSVAPGDVFGAIIYVRARRGTGVMAFILLVIAVFGFPVLVYYLTNAIYKLRTVAGHKYMAYHAVVKSVNSYKIKIERDGRKYEYKYGTLVGMKENQIKDTPATLIFIPDDVLVFPDEVVNSQ